MRPPLQTSSSGVLVRGREEPGALGTNFRTQRGLRPAGSPETPEGVPAQRRGWSPAFHLPPPLPRGQGGPGTQGGGGVPGSLPKVQQLSEAGLAHRGGRAGALLGIIRGGQGTSAMSSQLGLAADTGDLRSLLPWPSQALCRCYGLCLVFHRSGPAFGPA